MVGSSGGESHGAQSVERDGERLLPGPVDWESQGWLSGLVDDTAADGDQSCVGGGRRTCRSGVGADRVVVEQRPLGSGMTGDV